MAERIHELLLRNLQDVTMLHLLPGRPLSWTAVSIGSDK
jgi:hypothetical protein